MAIAGNQNVRLISAGLVSRLRFDNVAAASTITVAGTRAHEIEVWIQLDTDLLVSHETAGGSLTTRRYIEETTGVRTFTKAGPWIVEFGFTNDYTGVTTVLDGELRLGTPAIQQERIPGALVVGDDTGAPGSALVSGMKAAIITGAHVLIRRDGAITATRTETDPATTQLGNVTIQGGSVTLTGVSTTIRAQALTMVGGTITLSGAPQAVFEVAGSMTATSNAAGPAAITAGAGLAGTLRIGLNPSPLDINVGDGPQEVDLRIDAPISQVIGSPGPRKTGTGTALATAISDVETRIAEGTLRLTGTSPIVRVRLEGGRLEAAGEISELRTTNGTLAIGTGGPDSLRANSITLGANTVFEVDLSGTEPGTGYDQLRGPFSSSVDLGGATLNLTVHDTAVRGDVRDRPTHRHHRRNVRGPARRRDDHRRRPDVQDLLSERRRPAECHADLLFPLRRRDRRVLRRRRADRQSEHAARAGHDDVPPGRRRDGHADADGAATIAHDRPRRRDLAEGRQRGDYGYTTYILLANPSATPADVTVTFLPDGPGGPIVKTYTVPATSRFNIDVGNDVPQLVDRSFGARVHVDNGTSIAVERSLYWSTNGIFWAGGTNALGIPLAVAISYQAGRPGGNGPERYWLLFLVCSCFIWFIFSVLGGTIPFSRRYTAIVP